MGCQKLKMDIPDTGRKLAINGMITSDKFFNLRITKSSYITELPTADDFSTYDLDSADIFLYNNAVCIDTLQHIDNLGPDFMDWWDVFPNSNYFSKSEKPIPGKEYEVIAKFPGLPDASATTVIPDLVKIDKVDSMRVALAPLPYYGTNTGLRFKIKFSDPANQNNFYMFRMFLNTYYDPYEGYYVPYQSENMWFMSEDPIIEEKINHVNGTVSLIFSDKVINGQSYSLDITIRGDYLFVSDGTYTTRRKTIYFKLYSITEEYFKYLKTLHEYSQTYGNPLAEPVLVNSNVTGGYGMFTGAAVSTDSIVFQY